MSNPLRELPPSSVSDRFIDYLREGLEGDGGISDHQREYLAGTALNSMKTLVKYMKKNGFVFATTEDLGNGLTPTQRVKIEAAVDAMTPMTDRQAEQVVATLHRMRQPPQSVKCTESNTIPRPSEYKGKGRCGTCDAHPKLKQNGRLPVHWEMFLYPR